MDKKKSSYVTRGNNKRKAFNSKTHVLKKNGHFWGKIPKRVDFQVVREWEASDELIDHEQKDQPKDKDVLALINMSIINTLIASSSRPTMATLDEDDSKKIGKKL